jgi:hypothetical protein
MTLLLTKSFAIKTTVRQSVCVIVKPDFSDEEDWDRGDDRAPCQRQFRGDDPSPLLQRCDFTEAMAM